MKLFASVAVAGLALIGVAGAATAQPAPHSTTTVERVHGPLKILPHHNRKICRTHYVHHRKVRKCSYR